MLDYKVREAEQQAESLDERVIEIARVAKVVKGGRRFQFRVTLVIGWYRDRQGQCSAGCDAQGD
jgi:small subunit ribosomal protein S5